LHLLSLLGLTVERMGLRRMRKLMTAAVLLLTSCGPLTGYAKSADEAVKTLEACCIDRLKAGKSVEVCDAAFEAHDDFLQSWEIAKMTGMDDDLMDAGMDLSRFVRLSSLACSEAVD